MKALLAKKKLLPIAIQVSIFLLFLAIAFLTWYSVILSPGIPFTQGGEWETPPFPEQVEQIFERKLTPWTTDWELGVPRASTAGIWYNLALYLVARLGLGGEFIAKFFPVFIMAMAGYFFFLLGRQLKLGNLPSVLAGLFYMLTPYIFTRLYMGHLGIMLGYALVPLVLAFFIKSIGEKHRFKWLLAATIMMALAGLAESLFTVIAIILFLYFLVDIWGKGRRCILTSLGSLAFILIVSATFINFFWIDLTKQFTSGLMSTVFGGLPIEFFRDPGIGLEDSFRLLDTRLDFFQYIAKGWSPWKVLSFLPALLGFSALLIKPRDKRVIFFSLLTVVGIVLVSGPAMPLWGPVWIWLQNHIAPLAMFRDTPWFYSIACLGSAMLFGLFGEIVWEGINRLSKGRLWLYTTTFLVLSSIIFAYAWPFFTKDFGGYLQSYKFNQNYEEVHQWVSQDPDDHRVLPLPGPYPIMYLDQKESIRFSDPMSMYPGKPTIVFARLYEPQIERFIFKTAYEKRTEHLGQLLGLVNIKYVIFDTNKRHAGTDLYQVEHYFPEEKYDNDKLAWTLEHQTDIELLDTIGSIQIFDNRSYLPHIFPVGGIGLLAGDLDALVSLSYLEELRLQDMGLVFVSQLSQKDLETLSQLPNVRFLIQDGYQAELILAAASREKYELNLLEYVGTGSPSDGWSILWWYWRGWYLQSALDRVVYTLVPDTIHIPYTADHDGSYQVYLKLYFGPSASTMKVYFDEEEIGEVTTETPAEGFRWVRLDSVYLPEGRHSLGVESTGGYDALASIAVIPEEVASQAEQRVTDLVKGKPVMLLSELGGQVISPWLTWSQDAETLSEVFSQRGRRRPDGAPYHIEVQDDSLVVQLTSLEDRDESYGVVYAIDPPVDLREDMIFKFSYKLDDPTVQEFRIIWEVDYDGDGKTDVWLRPWPSQEQKEPSVSLRADGIYSVSFYYPFSDLKDYHNYRVDLGKVMEESFPDRKNPRLIGLNMSFLKHPVPGGETGEKTYNFYVKDISLAWPPATNFKMEQNERASAGLALFTDEPEPQLTSQQLYIPKQGIYNLSLRYSSKSPVTVSIEDLGFEASLPPTQDQFQYYNIGNVQLPKGTIDIDIQSHGGSVFLDQLLITQPIPSSEPKAELTSQKIKSSEYKISVKAEEPFYLFFSERYHPLWSLYLPDGEKLKSYPGYSFGNLFFIDRTGDFQMTLKYQPQIYYDIGLPLSFGSLAIMLLLIVTPTRWLKIPRRKRRD